MSAVTDATPSSEVSLLLERLTHLVLRIELDKEDGILRINDGRVDLAGKVAIARAEVSSCLRCCESDCGDIS